MPSGFMLAYALEQVNDFEAHVFVFMEEAEGNVEESCVGFGSYS